MVVLSLIVLGDAYVGKTTLLEQYSKRRVDSSQKKIRGYEYIELGSTLPDIEIKVEIYELECQQRFSKLRQKYFANKHGVLLVFDLSRYSSFEALKNLTFDMFSYENRNPKMQIALIGTKLDLIGMRDVNPEEITDYLQELSIFCGFDVDYYELNVKDTNTIKVSKVFHDLYKNILNHHEII